MSQRDWKMITKRGDTVYILDPAFDGKLGLCIENPDHFKAATILTKDEIARLIKALSE